MGPSPFDIVQMALAALILASGNWNGCIRAGCAITLFSGLFAYASFPSSADFAHTMLGFVGTILVIVGVIQDVRRSA